MQPSPSPMREGAPVSPESAAGFPDSAAQALDKLQVPADSYGARARAPSPRYNLSLACRGKDSRGASTPGSARAGFSNLGVAVKAVQESTILSAVRKQMEELEDKLSGQIQRVQLQSDRLRDAALARVDSKMGTMEQLQPKLDRRLAELSGNYKGLSDEMHTQVRRITQMDSRLWEWRHQLEEEMRTKFTEIDGSLKQLGSAHRVEKSTNEEVLKRYHQRVLRLETVHDERAAVQEDANKGLVSLHERMSQLEELQHHETSLFNSRDARNSAQLSLEDSFDNQRSTLDEMSRKVADACQKLEQLKSDHLDTFARVEAHEERMRVMVTKAEAKDEHHRALSDRIERADWDGRVKDLLSRVVDMDNHRVEHAERLEVQQKRLEGLHESLDSHEDQVRKLNDRLLSGSPDMGSFDNAVGEGTFVPGDALSMEMKECMEGLRERVAESEDRLGAVCNDLQSIQSDLELAPHVAALVDQLKNVAPKVIEQEAVIQSLLEKTGHLEVKQAMGAQGATAPDGTIYADGKVVTALGARVGRLEVEVGRLCSEVEGTDMLSGNGNQVTRVNTSY